MGTLNNWFGPKDRANNDNTKNEESEVANVYEQEVAVVGLEEEEAEVDPIEYYGL